MDTKYSINTTILIPFSPSCNKIFYHEGDEQYTRWMTNIKCQSLTLCTATQESYDIISSFCVPIKPNNNNVFKCFSQNNIQQSVQTNIRTLDGDVVVFSRHFLNPFVMSLMDIMDDIGDVNVPDCFFNFLEIYCLQIG